MHFTKLQPNNIFFLLFSVSNTFSNIIPFRFVSILKNSIELQQLMITYQL